MRDIKIAEISIDHAGRLLIRPTSADPFFQYVYRAAAEVNWDAEAACFSCPKPREWSYVRWFQHACDTVRSELGCDLNLTEHTMWTNVPDGVRAELVSAPNAR